MIETKALSVRIDTDLHSRVRRKAFEEHIAVEALLRGWLQAYADGTLMADGARQAPATGAPRQRVAGDTVSAPKPAAARTNTCPHRVAPGSFCKRCDGGEE